MTDPHSATLMAKHAQIDARIAQERSRAAPDDLLVGTLKRQKLRLKEMLGRLT